MVHPTQTMEFNWVIRRRRWKPSYNQPCPCVRASVSQSNGRKRSLHRRIGRSEMTNTSIDTSGTSESRYSTTIPISLILTPNRAITRNPMKKNQYTRPSPRQKKTIRLRYIAQQIATTLYSFLPFFSRSDPHGWKELDESFPNLPFF